MSDFDVAHATVCALIDKFARGAATYRGGSYKEAEARDDFLTPLFIALGWDVRHETQLDPLAQEVKIEKSVHMAEGRKSADYAFALAPQFARTRFFCEVKKPSVKLSTPDNCFQTIRYGWNGNTPISLLSNFETTCIMDCRAKPELGSATARVLGKWHFSEWRDRDKFAEFYARFGRAGVADGSIERFVEHLSQAPAASGKQRRLFKSSVAPVDTVFLDQLEEWRAELAVAFRKTRPTLTADDLTESTQRALDRLVFLRFLEDKLIETDDRVSRWSGGDAWREFRAAAGELNRTYNGVLWRTHWLLDDPDFNPLSVAWQTVCWNISNQQTPYLFNLIPIPILGSIYERFLGNVIEIGDDDKPRVVVKPVVRKAGGVYYTPQYIVDYIVGRTVDRLILDKAPIEVGALRFADIACGSGSFLLGIYDALLRWHTAYYNANPKRAPKEDVIDTGAGLRLSLKARREILLNNVWGSDIDAQAVEVSKLSLYLKLLEDETANSARQFQLDFGERILPDLDHNIVCGNALIGWDINDKQTLSKAEEAAINPMDWNAAFPQIMRAGGFDAIVGNPPYGAEFSEPVKSYIKQKFSTHQYKFESYVYFIEKAIGLTRGSGLVGYIVPELWLNLKNAQPLRELIAQFTSFESILVLGENVFSEVVVNTVATVFKNGVENASAHRAIQVHRNDGEKWQIEKNEWQNTEGLVVQYRLSPKELILVRRVQNLAQPLSSFGDIIQGITSYDKYKGHSAQLIKNRGFHHSEKIDDTCGKWLAGADVSRYKLSWSGEWLSYGEWLGAARELRYFEGPRLLFREIPGEHKRIQATYIEDIAYYGHSVTPFKAHDSATSLLYLLAVVNSRLLSWFGASILPNLGKTIFPKLNPADVKQLPIRAIDFTNAADKAAHDKLVHLVEQMLEAQRELAGAVTERDTNRATNKIASLDSRIDQLVYELYDLTADEIAVVETSFFN